MSSGTPRYISLGAEDLSKVQDLPEIAEKGTVILNHIGYFEKGPQYSLVNGKNILSVFGEKAFDKTSPFYFHNNKFLRQWVGRGASAFVERIMPDDANSPANLCIYLDVLEKKIPNYKRDSFGFIVTNALGEKVVDDITPEIDGIVVKLIKKYEATTSELATYGSKAPITGTMVDEDSNPSRMYPILELRGKGKGNYYNDIGIALNSYNQYELDKDLVKSVGAVIYGFKLFQRQNGVTTPKTIRTLADMQYLDVCLKPNARNTNTNANLSLDTIYSKAYFNEKAGSTIRYKETEDIFIYHDFLGFVLDKIVETEKPHLSDDVKTWDDGETTSNMTWFDYNSTTTIEEDKYTINLFTGKSLSGVPYYSLLIDNSIPVGLDATTSIINISNNTPIYLSGGSDGTMSKEDLYAKTSNILKEYTDESTLRVNNIAFPGMFMVDSGYPLSVKKDMFYFITVRPDTFILQTTEIDVDLNKRRFNAANSIGIARALEARAMLAPESTTFNTECMRAAAILGSFETDDEPEFIPNTFEIMDYIAEMMGGKKWKGKLMFDKSCYGRHGTKYHPEAVTETIKPTYWKLGIIVPELTNRDAPKFLGLCTLYPNSTSVANNIFAALALCVCERLAKDTWLEVGGDMTSTNAVFIDLATRDLTKRHVGIFDGVFRTSINVALLERDIRNGNTFNIESHIFGNVAKTGAYHSTKFRRNDENIGE